MPNYDFKKDLPVANATEKEVANILERRHNAKNISFENTNKYDIKAEIKGVVRTFEVKEDFTCQRTGNVGVEFECRGKASGIAVSQAELYIYKIHTQKYGIVYRVMKTETLKKMIANNLYFKIVSGGDEGSNSKNYLFKLDVFLPYTASL